MYLVIRHAFVRTALSPIEGLKLAMTGIAITMNYVRTALSPIEGLKR